MHKSNGNVCRNKPSQFSNICNEELCSQVQHFLVNVELACNWNEVCEFLRKIQTNFKKRSWPSSLVYGKIGHISRTSDDEHGSKYANYYIATTVISFCFFVSFKMVSIASTIMMLFVTGNILRILLSFERTDLQSYANYTTTMQSVTHILCVCIFFIYGDNGSNWRRESVPICRTRIIVKWRGSRNILIRWCYLVT